MSIYGSVALRNLVVVLILPSLAQSGVMQQALHGQLQHKTLFMPKGELLSWLNQLLKTDYTRVEQCANGAAYCQVLDSLFPVSLFFFDDPKPYSKATVGFGRMSSQSGKSRFQQRPNTSPSETTRSSSSFSVSRA